MASFDYHPHGVCTRNIHLELEDDGSTIKRVEFDGGCSGNLKAISMLVAGHSVEEVAGILAGNTCGKRTTSCADQLSQALIEASEQIKAGAVSAE